MKNKISLFRQREGLTQPQLAEKLNVSYTQIQAWEHERRTPPTEYAIRLARALNTTVEELFDIDD